MKRSTLLSASAVGVAIAATMLMSPAMAQPPPYNPYPDDILPFDIVNELNRVEREIQGI